MHTTTFSEMFPVEGDGYIIDTPGIKGFGTFDMKDEEVGHYFKEIFEMSAQCKYGNCTHRHEPGCAVREAVEKHYISESRYTSYLNILEDKEEGKYRSAYTNLKQPVLTKFRIFLALICAVCAQIDAASRTQCDAEKKGLTTINKSQRRS